MSKKSKKSSLKMVRTAPVTRRQFAYVKNDVSLDFTLRIDTPTQLQDFKELMQAGIKDIDELLKSF